MRARISDWNVDAQVNLYPGAGHSFTCPWGPMRNEEADRAAWNDAITFLSAKWEHDIMSEPFFHVGHPGQGRRGRPRRLHRQARGGIRAGAQPADRYRRDDQVLLLAPGPALPGAVEMTGTGSWSAEQPEGFHHIGISDPGVAARCPPSATRWT